MVSVLIPVYNYEMSELVNELHSQLIKALVDFEILLIDDASEEYFKLKNRSLTKLSNVSYTEEKVNLGRSKIRNKLAEISKYDSLIYLDCDSQVVDSEFINNYLRHADKHPVVYGGRIYDLNNPVTSNYKLHWLYGYKREQWPAKVRNQEPNKSFQTNNFMIAKKVLLSIGFNENIIGYGHEDTLFGYELQKRGINILHIDNTVIHMGLESNEEFLRKTREGIKNLKRIMRINGNEKRLERDITILGFYKKIDKIKLTGAIEYFYKRYEHRLRKNLLSANPNLMLFDLYKLGYMCTLNGDL
jgi:cellulose synthase/poly-beta-1,6-N-acetylglucosamine synthase-like glycosyltransferase